VGARGVASERLQLHQARTFKCWFQRTPNGLLWPIPAVPVMNSTRGCPTATCDPVRSFMVVAASVGFQIAIRSFNCSERLAGC